MQPHPPTAPLSAREAQVLRLIARGESYEAISIFLAIQPRTVRQYATQAKMKLGARRMAEAAATAVHLGLINVDDEQEGQSVGKPVLEPAGAPTKG